MNKNTLFSNKICMVFFHFKIINFNTVFNIFIFNRFNNSRLFIV